MAELAICQKRPLLCTTLQANVDPEVIERLLGSSTRQTAPPKPTMVRPTPVPLVSEGGFAGSYAGLKSLEGAFFPLLVGAIAVVVLFDYGI